MKRSISSEIWKSGLKALRPCLLLALSHDLFSPLKPRPSSENSNLRTSMFPRDSPASLEVGEREDHNGHPEGFHEVIRRCVGDASLVEVQAGGTRYIARYMPGTATCARRLEVVLMVSSTPVLVLRA